jgi:hypothetical protein
MDCVGVEGFPPLPPIECLNASLLAEHGVLLRLVRRVIAVELITIWRVMKAKQMLSCVALIIVSNINPKMVFY